MKKKIIIVSIMIMIMMFVGIASVYADSAECHTRLKNDEVNIGDTITLEIATLGIASLGDPDQAEVLGLYYTLYFDPSVLEFVEFTPVKSNWNVETEISEVPSSFYKSLLIDISSKTDDDSFNGDYKASDFVKMGTITFKVKDTSETSTRIELIDEDTSYKIIKGFDTDGVTRIPVTETCNHAIENIIEIKHEAFVDEIKVDGELVEGFAKGKLTYKISTKKDEITISAKAPESYTISGDTGKKELKEETNNFTIKVKSDKGAEKEYKITVTKLVEKASYTFPLIMDANGGEGKMEGQTLESGAKIVLPKNTFTKKKTVFMGWNLYLEDATGKKEAIKDEKGKIARYEEGTTIENLVVPEGYKLIAVAEWSPATGGAIVGLSIILLLGVSALTYMKFRKKEKIVKL